MHQGSADDKCHYNRCNVEDSRCQSVGHRSSIKKLKILTLVLCLKAESILKNISTRRYTSLSLRGQDSLGTSMLRVSGIVIIVKLIMTIIIVIFLANNTSSTRHKISSIGRGLQPAITVPYTTSP